MNPFDSPYWDLEQIRAWAETRDPNGVRFAAPAIGKSSAEIQLWAVLKATEVLQAGRDVDAELWQVSGYMPGVQRYVAHSYAAGVPLQRGHRVVAPWDDAGTPDVQGPPRHIVREQFPTARFMEHLFRTGKLNVIGNRPGNPTAERISKESFSGLEIATGGKAQRLSVWLLRTDHDQDEGVFANVCVAREEVLKKFPAEPQLGKYDEPKPISDNEVRRVIRDAMRESGGFIGQKNGAEIVRKKFPGFKIKRAMALVKELTGNTVPGPKGPRKKSCS